MADHLPRGGAPPGTYAGGGRSPIVYVWLCPVCAGYAPTVPDTDYLPLADKHCQGCGAYVREVHKFQALIMSAANGGCFCEGHRQVTGDLPTEESAMQLWTEVKTRPALTDPAERRRAWRASLRGGSGG